MPSAQLSDEPLRPLPLRVRPLPLLFAQRVQLGIGDEDLPVRPVQAQLPAVEAKAHTQARADPPLHLATRERHRRGSAPKHSCRRRAYRWPRAGSSVGSSTRSPVYPGNKMVSALVQSRLRVDPDALRKLCRRHHIVKLSLFGSVLRGDFRPDSDVDVLVEFEPGHVPGYLRLADVALELDALVGRAIDLQTPRSISGAFRDEVAATAELLYAAE